MENKTCKIVRPFARLIISAAIISIVVFLSASIADADGKLRRVKEAVRKNQPKTVSRPAPKRERRNDSDQPSDSNDDHHDSGHRENSHHDHHSGHDHRRSNHNRHHGRGSRSAGIVFYSPPQRCIEPVVIPVVSDPICPSQEHFIIEQHYPVQAPVPQPVYEPVINDPPISTVVVQDSQAVLSPAVEPVSTVLPPPQPQEIVVVENNFGGDWFETNTSRFWATIGSDFDDITTGGLGLHLQSPGSIGLEGSVTTLRESTEYYRDHLWIGDVNLVYEILARGDVRGRIGLGVNWLSDSWGAEAGFNLTAGVDVRLTERLILTGEGDLGSLGDADYFHGRVNFARRFETCELMLGFEHYNIGGADINTFFTGILFRF